MKRTSVVGWGTEKELEWLNAIGDTANKSLENPTNAPKTKFLEGYVAGSKNRKNWTGINKELCVKSANELLGALKNGY